MKTFDGYKKRNLTDKDYALLAGGGHKALDTLFSALSSDTTNAIKITVGGAEKSISTSTLKTSLGLGSNAYTSTAYLPLAGGTMTGALTIKGVTDTGQYSQGGFNKAYANIILQGDNTYGVSGIVFKSMKANDTNINTPSDVAFILYHPMGVTAAAYNTTPILNSSGERSRLVIGIGNDVDNGSSSVGEELWLQTAGTTDLKHYVVNTGYTIWDAGNDGSGSGLDADLLDGYHANGLFTAFSNNGSLTTRITIGGVTKDLKIDADTIDGYHASGLVKFYLSPMTSGAPADSAKSWFVNTMPSASGAIVYNVPGSEKTIIAGKSSGTHGHMLQLNYDDNYLRILRYYGGAWKTTDWEKISAGYADSAGSVAWANVTNKPYSSFGTASLYDSVGTFDSVLHSDYPNNQSLIITRSFISCWNGAYNSSNSSNLKYCTYGTILGTSNYSSYALPLSGGTMTGTLNVRTGGIWVQGGSEAGSDNTRMSLVSGMPSGLAYNTSKRGVRIYSNAIAFADPYNGNSNNDSGWIRHLETTANKGLLEIAAGDDASNEEIRFRYYNTSSIVAYDILVPRKTGTIALSGESLPASDVYAWAKASTKPSYSYGDGYLSGFGSAATKSSSDFVNINSGYMRTWEAYAGLTYIGWVRILKFTLNTSNHIDCNSFILTIMRNYNSPSSESYIVTGSFGWMNAHLTQIGGKCGSLIIQKLRIVTDVTNHAAYLEMYVATNYTTYKNTVYLSLWGRCNYTLTNLAELETIADSSLTIHDTINLSSSGNFVGNLNGNAASATTATTATYTNYLKTRDTNVTISSSTWANNPWGASNMTVVWGLSGKYAAASGDTADITLQYGTLSSAGGAGWFLNINGGIYTLSSIYAPSYYTNSDIRYKNIINNIELLAKDIADLPLFTYLWKDGRKDKLVHVGSSAQSVEVLVPELVSLDNNGFRSLDYPILGVVAGITACKELVNLKSEIDLLKERIKELELQLKMINDYGRC